MAVLTVVVAMMMIHHPGRPFPFPFLFRSAFETWKPWQWDLVYVNKEERDRNEEERGRTY
jgi:hypothetical protein